MTSALSLDSLPQVERCQVKSGPWRLLDGGWTDVVIWESVIFQSNCNGLCKGWSHSTSDQTKMTFSKKLCQNIHRYLVFKAQSSIFICTWIAKIKKHDNHLSHLGDLKYFISLSSRHQLASSNFSYRGTPAMNMEFRVSLKDSKPCTQSSGSQLRCWQIHGTFRSRESCNKSCEKKTLFIYIYACICSSYKYIYISHVWPTVCHFKWANFYTIVISPPKNGSSCVLLSSFPGVVPATRNRLAPWYHDQDLWRWSQQSRRRTK